MRTAYAPNAHTTGPFALQRTARPLGWVLLLPTPRLSVEMERGSSILDQNVFTSRARQRVYANFIRIRSVFMIKSCLIIIT
jgi:hypothetical protein